VPLPTTTAPEQLLLTWGADPATAVTVVVVSGHGGPAGTETGLLDLADHGRQPGPDRAPARAEAAGRDGALPPWSAAINVSDAYGYAIFDVDPGERRGETTITMQYFAIPAVSNEAGSAHDGTTTLPTKPFETFVFGRRVPHTPDPSHRPGAKALEGSTAG
jgi:hypothetical protein